MNRLQSLFLDTLRGFAAIAVVLHHYNGHIFNVSRNMANGSIFPNIGQEAVIIFFVLSGFVISYVAHNNENNFCTFITKRMCRFYSVVIPVMLLAIVLYIVTSKISPNLYDYLNKGDIDNLGLKGTATLLFLNHNFLFTANLPACGPFWSLVCEWWYYVFFSILFFFGNRLFFIILLFLLVSFMSPMTLLLFPIWWLGNLAYIAYNRIDLSNAWIYGLCIGSAALAIFFWSSGWRYTYMSTEFLAHRSFSHATYFPYFYFIGASFSVFTFALLKALSDNSRSVIKSSITRFFLLPKIAWLIRRTAHCSFFLYLMHMPIMIFLKAALPSEYTSDLHLIPFLTIILCMAFGPSIESLRRPMFRFLAPKVEALARKVKSNKRIHSILYAPLRDT
jgi:peptidoglycan/LPS O-acetylase OafA/YrhL